MKLKTLSAAVLFSLATGSVMAQTLPPMQSPAFSPVDPLAGGGAPLIDVADKPVYVAPVVDAPILTPPPTISEFVPVAAPAAPIAPDGYTPFTTAGPTIVKNDAHTIQFYESSAYGISFAETVFDTNGAYSYDDIAADRYDPYGQYNRQVGVIDEGATTALSGKTYKQYFESLGSGALLSKATVQEMKAILEGGSIGVDAIAIDSYGGFSPDGLSGEWGTVYVLADGAYVPDNTVPGGYRKILDGADLLADINAQLAASPDRTEGVSQLFYDNTSEFYAAFVAARDEHQALYGDYEVDLGQYQEDYAAWQATYDQELQAYQDAVDSAEAANAAAQSAYHAAVDAAEAQAQQQYENDLAAWEQDFDGKVVDAINNKIPNLRGLGGGYAPGNNAVAFGPGAVAAGDGSIATGNGAYAAGQGSVAVGNNAAALQAGAIAIGDGAVAENVGSVAIGAGAYAKSSVAVGIGAQATGTNTTAIGDFAEASGNRSVSIGVNADAQAADSVALGANTVADQEGTVAVGGRRVTQVGDPVDETDAVNVRHLEKRLLEIQPIDSDEILRQSHDYTDAQINKLDKRLSAGIAAVAATPAMPALAAGERAIAAGVANYNGQQAISIGYGHAINNTDYVTASVGVGTGGRPVFRASLAKKF